MEGFERLSQNDALKMAVAVADTMAEALSKHNSTQKIEGKTFIELDVLRQTLVPLYVSFLADQYLIIPE